PRKRRAEPGVPRHRGGPRLAASRALSGPGPARRRLPPRRGRRGRRSAAAASPAPASPAGRPAAPTGMAMREADPDAGALRPMAPEEAERWVRAVGGVLVQHAARPDGTPRWVALVRTPAAPGAKSRLIVGLGETPAG